MYNSEFIKIKISNNQKWLERAIVALYNKQTGEEKYKQTSVENNHLGFNKPDAKIMSYYAKYIIHGNHLSGRWFYDAKRRILKYSKQLTKIANNKI